MGKGTTEVPRIRATDSATLASSFTSRQMEALHVVTPARHFGAVVGGGKASTYWSLNSKEPMECQTLGCPKIGVLFWGMSL